MGKDLRKEKGEALRGGKALGGKGGKRSQQGKGGNDLGEERGGGGGEDLREERGKIWKKRTLGGKPNRERVDKILGRKREKLSGGGKALGGKGGKGSQQGKGGGGGGGERS